MKSIQMNCRLMIVLIAAVLASGSTYTFAEEQAKTIKVTAKKFEYSPNEIRLKKGEPVILELTSLDVAHGFNCPDLGARADIIPGRVSQLRIVPKKTGTFTCYCDIYCGVGHENLTGTLVVED